MAKPNYFFQKQKRELAKKSKKEAKLQRRAAKNETQPAEPSSETPEEKIKAEK